MNAAPASAGVASLTLRRYESAVKRAVFFVLAATSAGAAVAPAGCAAAVPRVAAADPDVVGPPPPPSLYERAGASPAQGAPVAPALAPVAAPADDGAPR
jgi:hypothetical protein